MDGPPSHGRAFAYYTYGAASSLLQSLARDYPQLASLTTAQEAYGLRSAGTCTDSAGHQGPCLNHIIQISNRSANAAVLSARPQIYISGALHGDEQVGIVTALELCRWLLTRYAIDDWVRRLVDTRMVLISPMTNAVGSATRRRDELGIDPNRDFPFDQSAGSCMQTVTARTVNEIYRAHLLQLVVTFHGGMQAPRTRYPASPRRPAGETPRAPLRRRSGTTGAPTRTGGACRAARPTTPRCGTWRRSCLDTPARGASTARRTATRR